MSKNETEIQRFLDDIKAGMTSADSDPSIISFDEFWSEKYSADDKNFNRQAFLSDITLLQVHDQVTYYKELTSYKSGISKIVVPVKKVIRKIVAFLFLPVIAEQNEINLSMLRIVKHLRSYVNCNPVNGADLTERVNEQDAQIRELTAQVAQLTAKLEAMEKGEQK